MHPIQEARLWIVFIVLIAVVLVVDLLLLGGHKARKVTTRTALIWTVIWFACAVIFNFALWRYLLSTQSAAIANQKALEFFTGYLIEETLSFDNMFVILMIFRFFTVPHHYQRRVLMYGVLGAVVMRFVMIYFGTWLVSQLHWILYIFGIFLVWMGARIFFEEEKTKDFEQSVLFRLITKCFRVTKKFHEERFFVRQNAFWYATPLFIVLVLIESSDLVFALDSIPAIFSVTLDPFIVFTSNIFAIMGLRAIYFLLANLANRFMLLKYGIGCVLIFVGAKMLLAYWIEIPVLLALCVVVFILLVTALLSLRKRTR